MATHPAYSLSQNCWLQGRNPRPLRSWSALSASSSASRSSTCNQKQSTVELHRKEPSSTSALFPAICECFHAAANSISNGRLFTSSWVRFWPASEKQELTLEAAGQSAVGTECAEEESKLLAVDLAIAICVANRKCTVGLSFLLQGNRRVRPTQQHTGSVYDISNKPHTLLKSF